MDKIQQQLDELKTKFEEISSSLSNFLSHNHDGTSSEIVNWFDIFDLTAVAPTLLTTGTMNVEMTSKVVTITPTGDCTFNARGGFPGNTLCFYITTTGTTSRTLTFGTNFKTTGTLATGTVTAKTFLVTFRCLDGITWAEASRTTAM